MQWPVVAVLLAAAVHAAPDCFITDDWNLVRGKPSVLLWMDANGWWDVLLSSDVLSQPEPAGVLARESLAPGQTVHPARANAAGARQETSPSMPSSGLPPPRHGHRRTVPRGLALSEGLSTRLSGKLFAWACQLRPVWGKPEEGHGAAKTVARCLRLLAASDAAWHRPHSCGLSPGPSQKPSCRAQGDTGQESPELLRWSCARRRETHATHEPSGPSWRRPDRGGAVNGGDWVPPRGSWAVAAYGPSRKAKGRP